MKSLSGKVMLFFVLIIVAPLVVINLTTYSITRQKMKDQIIAKMELGIKAKAALIKDILDLFKLQADFINRCDSVSNVGPNSFTQETEVFTDAWQILHAYQESQWGLFHHIYLADLEGEVFLSPNHVPDDQGISALDDNSQSGHFGDDISESSFFAASLSAVQITDFFAFAETDHFHQNLMHPVVDKNGNTMAILCFEIEIGYIVSR